MSIANKNFFSIGKIITTLLMLAIGGGSWYYYPMIKKVVTTVSDKALNDSKFKWKVKKGIEELFADGSLKADQSSKRAEKPVGLDIPQNLITDMELRQWAEENHPELLTQISVKADSAVQPAITVNGEYDNLSCGTPGKADCIINREGYALGYIEEHEQPAWVTYKLTRNEVLSKVTKRGDDFREDPEIPTGSATLGDYRGSGYDRGHSAPAADMAFSVKAMNDSFYMSNMSPQRPDFNRGIWKDLEEQVRHLAVKEHEIMVVTGPVLPKTKSITIGKNKVTVPSHYYKVIYDLTPPQKMIGFILPNKGSKKPLRDFAVTVDAVEKATGLNFFSTVPQPQQEQMKKTITIKDWSWQK